MAETSRIKKLLISAGVTNIEQSAVELLDAIEKKFTSKVSNAAIALATHLGQNSVDDDCLNFASHELSIILKERPRQISLADAAEYNNRFISWPLGGQVRIPVDQQYLIDMDEAKGTLIEDKGFSVTSTTRSKKTHDMSTNEKFSSLLITDKSPKKRRIM